MYSHKLKKVKKTNLRNKRDVVNNTRGLYTKHSKHSKNSKNSKNTKNALKTNLRSLHKNTKIKNAKMPKSKQNTVLHGGASGANISNKEIIINGDAEMRAFSLNNDEKKHKIISLSIHSCNDLSNLPTDSLQALTKLTIYNCNGLTSLPDRICDLTALEMLTISSCNSLQSLPDNFGNLIALKELNIQNCDGLKSLPDSFGKLKALKIIFINRCRCLTSLSDSVGGLQTLNELHIHNCNGLKSLPKSFGGLQNLEKLEIHDCNNLTSLPDSIGGLKNLKTLTIRDCDNLTSLPHSIGLCFNLKLILFNFIEPYYNLPSFNEQIFPPSVILMPYIKVNNKSLTWIYLLGDKWFTYIKETTDIPEFYTCKILKLITWDTDSARDSLEKCSITRNMINMITEDTITRLIFGMNRIGHDTNTYVPYTLDMIKTFTLYLQRPKTKIAKFLFQNQKKSIKEIVSTCSDYKTFISLIEAAAIVYDRDDTINNHKDVNFYDDPDYAATIAAADAANPGAAADAAADAAAAPVEEVE